MKKKLSGLLVIVLVLSMLFGCANQANTPETGKNDAPVAGNEQVAQNSNYPEYLNLESARPVVKDGEEVTLSVMVMRDPGVATSDINEQWLVKFIEEELNVKLEIEEVFAENEAERKSLMLASNQLPDLILGVQLTPAEVVTYGVEGGQLLPVSDYLSEELTPNILAMFEANPAAMAAATANDGKTYSLPFIQSTRSGYGGTIGTQRVFLDTEYLKAIGQESAPETLDEFVAMLRAFKELDPATMGVDEIVPVADGGGLFEVYMANSFGWVTAWPGPNIYSDPCWDVETEDVVLPVMQDKFAEYVKIMHTLYEEGLIHQDYFTMDAVASEALMAEGKVPVVADWAHYLAQPERFEAFIGAVPLSSEWCENGVTAQNSAFIVNKNFISADTEYPELCLRLLDYFYTAEGSTYAYLGCPAGSEDTLGMIEGFTWDGNALVDGDVTSGKYPSSYDFQVNKIIISQHAPLDETTAVLNAQKMCGVENPAFGELDLTNPDDHYRYLCYEAHDGKIEPAIPEVYANAEDYARYMDLRTVISSYVRSEFAKFVVGQRSIDELPQFVEELKDMGVEEYQDLMESFYSNYNR